MRKVKVIISVGLFCAMKCCAQLPDTDVWLVSGSADTLAFYDPMNISNLRGYDNQPAFSPDGKSLYYTAVRDGKQADIYRYDLNTSMETQVTNTATSEYSPTFMPDQKSFSVVMVEPDSVQRLWKFPVNGGAPSPVLPQFDSIGYHCWFYGKRAAVFLLTEPPSLQLISNDYKRPRFISDSIGRCVKYYNGMLYYTRKTKDGSNELYFFNLPGWHTESTGIIIESEDFVLFKNKIIYAKGKKIYSRDMNSGTIQTIFELGLEGQCADNISRLAINKDGNLLAFAAEYSCK
jgi:dipeptidyl aminopeptidase/acylaminoacyl peptidase